MKYKTYKEIFDKTLDKLANKNAIMNLDFTPETQMGLYGIMQAYNLRFSFNAYGTFEWFSLHTQNDDTPLSKSDILKMPFSEEKFKTAEREYNNGTLLDIINNKNADYGKDTYDGQYDLGWLSPIGEFYKARWGDHDIIAKNIIQKYHWYEEYINDDEYVSARDFLNRRKNFVLIDNPSMHEIIVTEGPRLTRAQKSYLYDFYHKLGMNKAELYAD